MYANKKELLNILDQQQTKPADVAFVLPENQVKQGSKEALSSATKVVENFENPIKMGHKMRVKPLKI